MRWRAAPIGTKQDWQDRFRNIKFGRKDVEDTEKVENSAMSVPFYDENLYLLNMKNDLEAKVAFYMLNSSYLVCLLLLCMMFDQLSMVPAAFYNLLCTKDVRTFSNIKVVLLLTYH